VLVLLTTFRLTLGGRIALNQRSNLHFVARLDGTTVATILGFGSGYDKPKPRDIYP
jgi:hypothetical protein